MALALVEGNPTTALAEQRILGRLGEATHDPVAVDVRAAVAGRVAANGRRPGGVAGSKACGATGRLLFSGRSQQCQFTTKKISKYAIPRKVVLIGTLLWTLTKPQIYFGTLLSSLTKPLTENSAKAKLIIWGIGLGKK